MHAPLSKRPRVTLSNLISLEKNSRFNQLKSLLIALSFMGGTGSASAIEQPVPVLNVPQFGNSVGLIDRQHEQQLGERVLLQVRRELPEMGDPWLEDQMLQLFGRIYQQSGLGKPRGLVLIRDARINAFAVPGGVFAINSGVITAARSLDEVAAVMAHETAHVTQRHYSRSQEAFRLQRWLNLAGWLAGMAVSSRSPEAGAAVMMGSQAALLDQQLAYSRDQEREADRVGMQYLSVAGYQPTAMPDFFEQLQRSSSQLSQVPDFWRTHPLTTERMSETRLRARQYPLIMPSEQLRATQRLRFDQIRWRTLALSSATDLAQLQTAAAQQPAAALALAHNLIKQAQYAQAQTLLNRLDGKGVDSGLLAMTWTDLDLATGQPQRALSRIRPLAQLAPEQRALQLKLADAYLATAAPDSAITLLKRLSQRDPLDPLVWQKLMQAEQLRPSVTQAVNVLRYRAEMQYGQGDLENAIRSLLQAQRQNGLDDVTKAQIQRRLSAMQDMYQLKV